MSVRRALAGSYGYGAGRMDGWASRADEVSELRVDRPFSVHLARQPAADLLTLKACKVFLDLGL